MTMVRLRDTPYPFILKKSLFFRIRDTSPENHSASAESRTTMRSFALGEVDKTAFGPTGRRALALCGSAPSGGSGMLRSATVTLRAIVPGERVSYMGEPRFVECPSPNA